MHVQEYDHHLKLEKFRMEIDRLKQTIQDKQKENEDYRFSEKKLKDEIK